MLELFFKLLIAHMIGDFVFQSDNWVKDKETNKIKSKYLYLHLLVHALALFMCLMTDALNYWVGVSVILVAHYIIDLSKLYLGKKMDSRILFVLDQIAHLLVLSLVVRSYHPFTIDFANLVSSQFLLLSVSLLGCTSVVGVIMKILLSRWQGELDENEPMALENAGIYIGILERLFVFFFVVSQQYSGIGFLLAAKSVFRFGDLSKAKDRKLTEYILIGTLLSFGFAILIAKIYLQVKPLL